MPHRRFACLTESLHSPPKVCMPHRKHAFPTEGLHAPPKACIPHRRFAYPTESLHSSPKALMPPQKLSDNKITLMVLFMKQRATTCRRHWNGIICITSCRIKAIWMWYFGRDIFSHITSKWIDTMYVVIRLVKPSAGYFTQNSLEWQRITAVKYKIALFDSNDAK